MTADTFREVAQFDWIFFSGITLAILADEGKAAFLAFIAILKEKGKTIAFDPNHRAVLWRDTRHAARWLTEAYQLTDIALPGLSDHKAVCGHQSSEDVRAFLQDLKIGEIVLKADAAGVHGYLGDRNPERLTTTTERNPKDTTGAGDSFAGTYLAERLVGASMPDAIRSAAKVASLVVQHQGAIVDRTLYRRFVQRHLG